MAYIRAKDRIGTMVNGFYIQDIKRENNKTFAYIKCPYCKKQKWTRLDDVAAGKVVSCGCYNAENNYKKPIDIKDKIFNYLKALEPTKDRDKSNGSIIWKCKCKCGNRLGRKKSTELRMSCCGSTF